jgi:hypothetical protein
VSKAWFWLTWFASAAKASGSGLAAGGAVVLLDVLVVLVGVSCAYPAAAGRNDAVTNAPTITARARGMTVYRPEEPDC